MTYGLHFSCGKDAAERGMRAAQSTAAIRRGVGHYFPQTRVGEYIPAIADATGDMSLRVFRQDLLAFTRL